jgi:hypothetical protein
MLSDFISDNDEQNPEESLQTEPTPEMLSDLEKSYHKDASEEQEEEQWITPTDFEETAIENSLANTQKFLDEKLLNQEDLYDNIIDENQLT